jgi:uncharacterized membrane protein YkvA (DUF1232 family)
MRIRLKESVELLGREMAVLRAVYSDPRTPRVTRWLLGLALAYAISPIDLLPDFIPILGQLDDLIVVPALVFLALRLVPPEIYLEHRDRLEKKGANARRDSSSA